MIEKQTTFVFQMAGSLCTCVQGGLGHVTCTQFSFGFAVCHCLTRLFTVPYFTVRPQRSILEFDGPPSWSLDATKTGKSTNRLNILPVLTPPSLPTGILYSPQFCLHQDGSPSNAIINIYDLTGKQRTANSVLRTFPTHPTILVKSFQHLQY